jgi:hypothetical protein
MICPMVSPCLAVLGSDQGTTTMNRTAALLTITLLSSIATPFVVGATTRAPRDTTTAPVAAALVSPAVAETAMQSAEPSCVRKVRVIYRGYAETTGNACAQ